MARQARLGGARLGKAGQGVAGMVFCFSRGGEMDEDMKVYSLRSGARVPIGVDAQIIGETLEEIRKENDGKLQPPMIVKASEPKDAPLHACFEWRNSVAANHYRNWQARNLVKVVYVVNPQDQTKTVAYMSVNVDNELGKKDQYYQSTEIVIQRPDELMSAIGMLQSKLNAITMVIDEVIALAKNKDDPEKVSRLVIAANAIQTARDALRH